MKYESPVAFQREHPGGSPSRVRAWVPRVPWIFMGIVVLPTLISAIYFLFIAAPLYVSEAHFVVRSRSEGGPAALGSMLQSVGQSFGVSFGENATDAFEVHSYLVSRNAVDDMERVRALRALLSRPEADFWERFPRPFESHSSESLYKAYRRFVTVGYDSQTGISTLRVQAFRAADAQNLANSLLDGGEALVNRLNERAMADAVAQAQRQVIEAEASGTEAQAQLTAFRDRERLIDPERSSLAGLEIVGKLEGQLATMRAERASLAASAPESPQIPVLDRQIAAFDNQMETERSRNAGEADSLAPKVGEYEKLTLQRDLAVKTLESAVASLESARVEARRKQLYLDRVVSPNLPDRAIRPKRLYDIFIVFAATLVGYGILSLTIAGLREHRQQ